MASVIDRQSGPTPPDERKKRVSEVLKRVDMLLKQGDLRTALAETRHAKELDPRNVYALAFEERIVMLLDQEEKKRLKLVEDEEKRKTEEERRKKEQDEKAAKVREQAREEAQRRMAAQKAQPVLPPTLVPPQEAPPPPLRPQVAAPAPPSVQTPLKAGESLLDNLRNQFESYNAYKTALLEVWADGSANPDEEEWLRVLRETLHITAPDHERLEYEVQLESYLNALKMALSHGKITTSNADMLAEMRNVFKISLQDHDRIQARLLAESRAQEKSQDRIVVIDDDEKLLELITDTLKEAGYATLPFRTSDDAYAYLRSGQAPDLILCDVNLETSTMGGFSFYEKIQWLRHLQDVPFIFLTGLTDEVLIRTGKELGVDDYLTKPISDETLVATIRGKLKRFKRLKKKL